jgi:hypothetical protein
MSDTEKTVDAGAVVAAKYEAEQEDRRRKALEAKTGTVNGAKATGVLRSVPARQRPNAEAEIDLGEVVNEIGAAKGNGQAGPNFTFKEAPKEEPKADPDEKEALEAEAPVAASDLGPEEMKHRRIIRWKKLKEINLTCAVIRSFGGKCAIVTEGRSTHDPNRKVFDFQTKQAFEQWKANDFIPSLEKTNKVETVGPWWWRHPKRRQFDGVVFKPPITLQTVYASEGRRLFNTYRGWGVEPKPGDWPLMRRHIKEVLANGDPKTDDYIIRWIAWAIQHPDRPAGVALVLIGEKGTGKGTLARALEKVFGDHSFQASTLDHVTGRFNAHKENCILFVADEAYWGGHKSAAGELQRMITEPTLPIERKYFDIYEARNYIHMLMLGEPGWVIPAGRFERRYAAYQVSEAHMDDPKYFSPLYREIDGDGPAAMLYELKRMPLGDWHPRQVYKTEALRDQQEQSLPPLDDWMLGLLEDGALPGTQSGHPRDASPTTLLQDARSKVPGSHIGKNKLSTYLKKWKCVRHGGVARGYYFPSLSEMRATWDKQFGRREWPTQADWDCPARTPLGEILDERF